MSRFHLTEASNIDASGHSLPNECKDLTQQRRRLNKRKSVAILQPATQPDMGKGRILENTINTDSSTDIPKINNNNSIHREESYEVKRDLRQNQNSNVNRQLGASKVQLMENSINHIV